LNIQLPLKLHVDDDDDDDMHIDSTLTLPHDIGGAEHDERVEHNAKHARVDVSNVKLESTTSTNDTKPANVDARPQTMCALVVDMLVRRKRYDVVIRYVWSCDVLVQAGRAHVRVETSRASHTMCTGVRTQCVDRVDVLCVRSR
jgi:hypothetical protein